MQKFRLIPSASRRSALLKVFEEHKLAGCQRSISNGNADNQQYSSETETHFGEAIVSEKEKSEKVKAVFERVASRYDLMNDLMSFGIHRVWKDMFISRLRPGRNTKSIDVAGGTGDIAFRFLKYKETSPADLFKDQNFLRNVAPFTNRVRGEVGAEVSDIDPENPVLQDKREDDVQERSVLVCDINDKMIEVGRDRAIQNLNADELRRIDWMVGDAENLENVEDNTFDAYTIAFGIRNCVHVDQVLNEALRVLKPGGRFMCLEFSQVTNAALRTLYDEYSYQVIPPMGQVVAGDWDSYEYLVQSIRKFPNQEDFKHMIQAAGFRFVKYENLSGGICAIHSGFKL